MMRRRGAVGAVGVLAIISLTGAAQAASTTTDWKGDPVPNVYSDWSGTLDPSGDNPTTSDPSLTAIPEQDISVDSTDVGDTSVIEQPDDSLLASASPSLGSPARGTQTLSRTPPPPIISTTCNYPFSVKTAVPPAPIQAADPFAVAKVVLNSSGQDSGGTQADSTHRGTPSDTKSPTAKTTWLLAFKWGSGFPQGSSVIAHLNPAWRGKIALQAIQTTVTQSTAKAHFHLGSGFYDKTLSQHENDQTYANYTKTVVGTGNKRWNFAHPAQAADTTFGINLVPGHVYEFYSYAAAYAEVITDYTGPAAAAIDFGSAYLDTPASMTNSDGSSVNGFSRPGTGASNNKVQFVFKVPGYAVNC
jgi:hypothetical protein